MRGGLQRRLSTGVNAVLVALFVTGIVALTVDSAGNEVGNFKVRLGISL